MDCDEDADSNHIRVLPDACVELFINYTSTPVAIIGNELHKRSIVSFRMSQPMDVQMRKGSGCLAVCFQPGMAYQFFRMPMNALSNTTAGLSDVWMHLAEEIEDKLASALSNDFRVEIVQEYLLQQLANNKRDLQIEHCLKEVQDSSGLINVSKLSQNLGISQRHLSRKFQQCIGLSPKEYLRMSRFLRSLSYLKSYPAFSLTEIAYQSGYYDQAHFNRDYRTFSGHTPGEVADARHILY